METHAHMDVTDPKDKVGVVTKGIEFTSRCSSWAKSWSEALRCHGHGVKTWPDSARPPQARTATRPGATWCRKLAVPGPSLGGEEYTESVVWVQS
jgi:hypothetical protein